MIPRSYWTEVVENWLADTRIPGACDYWHLLMSLKIIDYSN